ncbi:hypothetical protein [Aeromonas media]|uniref:hypothetical protein n=1 Tax=Aeromonas media TaxID=651 RepID=UPI003D21DB17
MIKILHFNDRNGASVIHNISSGDNFIVLPPYEEKNARKINNIYDTDKFVEVAKDFSELTDKLQMMLVSSFMDMSYSFFARLSDGISMSLTPSETRRIFARHAAEQIKKSPMGEPFIFLTFAINMVIGIPPAELKKITSALEKESEKRAIYLKKMTSIKPIEWESMASRLVRYVHDELMPRNQFKQAKSILMYIAKSHAPGISEKDILDASDLYKEVVRCEKGYLHSNGQSTSPSFKKWSQPRQKMHPSMYMSSKINKKSTE